MFGWAHEITMSADGSYCLRYRIDEGRDFEASFSVLMQWSGRKVISIIASGYIGGVGLLGVQIHTIIYPSSSFGGTVLSVFQKKI